MKSSKPNLGPAGPYATKEDRATAKECGISVKQLRLDRANEDRAAFSQVIAKGKIITLGITPAQGKKNIALARKKSASMNLKTETVTLKRKPR